jgi:N6-adenosine-specific RNA methylase IME4
MATKQLNAPEGQYLGSGRPAWSDDEWETYIREADPATAIVERGRRIFQFSEDCREKYSKRGGSYFSEFMAQRFGMSQPVAASWKRIGENARLLICNANKFTADWSAMVGFTRLPSDAQAELLKGDELISRKTITPLLRAARNQADGAAEFVAPQPLGQDGVEKAEVLYVDPPWRYEYSVADSRQIENEYPTMSLEEICALPVEEAAADHCVLFLWATSPKLADAFDVLRAWGFAYKTCAVWDKERPGMGYYFRQQHELLLVATRGNPRTPDESARVPSVIRLRRDNQHSRKPAEFYELIEAMYPRASKREVFARQSRPGWLPAWGNQVAAAA